MRSALAKILGRRGGTKAPPLVVTLGLALAVLAPGASVPAQDERELAMAPIVGALTPPTDGLEGGNIGYEVGLSASTSAIEGRDFVIAGVAYEVAGLDELRRTRGLDVELTLIARAAPPDPERPEVPAPFVQVEVARTSTGEAGTFELALPMPTRPLVQPIVVLRVGRPGRPHRRWSFPITLHADITATLLTDRVLYEAGETLHAWVRTLDGESGGPLANRALMLSVTDGAGHVWAEHPVTTGASGAVSIDVPLAGSLSSGSVRVLVHDRVGEPERAWRMLAMTEVQVGVRHLERMRVALGLDRTLLLPGEQLTGMVQVVAADSTPVAGAEVVVEDDGTAVATLTTDGLGQARFSIPTASYLSGDLANHQVSVRVSHAAHGSAGDAETYTLSRTPYFVTVLPEMGALPIDLTTDLYVQVANARGEPAPAGVSVEVSGPSIVGSGRAVTEALGVARVRARVPREAAARASGGECGDEEAAAAITVAVQRASGTPREVSLCVPVVRDVMVSPHLDRVIVGPGDTIEVTLDRSGPRTPVLVELADATRTRSLRFVGANTSSVRLDIPDRAHGVWRVSVQPLTEDGARAPIDETGATWARRGGSTSFVVRPPDPFAVSLTTDAPAYMVRGTVVASIATDQPPAGAAWATLLVRDEAWQAGEIDFVLYTWTETMRELIAHPSPATDLALRHALAASAGYDAPVVGELPVEIAPWAADGIYEHLSSPPPGVLFDPIAARETLRRQTLPALAMALEQALSERAALAPEMGEDVIDRRGPRPQFRPDALASIGATAEHDGSGLGGRPLTPSDVERAQIGFSFDVAAARVARRQLVTLMSVLAQVGGTSDPSLARRYAVEPPERWLALAAHDGLVAASLLLDPWGRPFVFRDAGTRTPAIVVSDRAARWELLSAGPDGTYGNADDIRDPFARVVPAGSIYAERCGENALIAELSRIAPGPTALARMAEAYGELGLAAEDERVPSAVYAYASEAYDESDGEFRFGGGGTGEGTIGLGNIGTIGHGSGSGYGSGSGGFSSRSSSVPRVRMGSASLVAASALARVVREDFPATLRFIGEIELDAQGRASVPIELADAVSTYRLETIVWSQSGWTSSAMTRITVDQPVQIDAPIPERARVGDTILVPVRIVNRSAAAVRVRPTVEVEGEVALRVSALSEVEVPAHDGVALTLTVGASEVGQGAVRIEALAPDGERLDAVRRPIDVRADARPWSRTVDALLEDGGTLDIDVPDDALDGSGEVRVWLASQLFGAIDVRRGTGDGVVAAWLAAILDHPLDDDVVRELTDRVSDYEGEGAPEIRLGAGTVATIVGGMWASSALSDEACAYLLRYLAELLEVGTVNEPVGALLGLTPAIRHPEARAALADTLAEVAAGLRDAAAAAGAAASESPQTWAHVAAGLALAGDPDDHPRIDEMLRRIERHVIRVSAAGSLAWLEPDVDDGSSFEPRAFPTALYVLALIGRGRPADAMPAVRALVSMRAGAASWPAGHRALAIAAVSLIAPVGEVAGDDVRVTFDGAPLPRNDDGWSFAMGADAGASPWAVPGRHTLAASMPSRAMVLASIRSEHAVPWSRAEPRTLPVTLEWHGDVGARDTRSALYLEVHNRAPRVLLAPVIDIQLPSGAELDVEGRALLARAGTVETTADGIRITLRPLRVGGTVRIPLRARWSLAGSLRGLGVVLHDERSELDRVAILPSTDVVVPEAGEEPSYPRELGF